MARSPAGDAVNCADQRAAPLAAADLPAGDLAAVFAGALSQPPAGAPVEVASSGCGSAVKVCTASLAAAR